MKIYALCDKDLLEKYSVSLEAFIENCKVHHVEIIQYRDKNSTYEEKKANLIKLRCLWNGILIINDDINLIKYCDGIHMGQEDLRTIDFDFQIAISRIKSLVGEEKMIGLSTHNSKEVLVANSLDISYIGLGAYRTTQTKNVENVLGDTLDEVAKLSKHDVAAIGGVNFSDSFENVSYLVIGTALVEECQKREN